MWNRRIKKEDLERAVCRGTLSHCVYRRLLKFLQGVDERPT
jgi:hypothetical protein